MHRRLLIAALLALMFALVLEAAAQKRFYTSYRQRASLVTQSSTDAPTDSVLSNTIGGTWTWARTGAGVYTLTKAGGGLTASRMMFFLMPTDTVTCAIIRSNDSVVTVTTTIGAAPADGLLTAASLEIRKYP